MARRRRVRSRRYQCSATKPSSQAVASRAVKRQDKVFSKHKQEKRNMEFVDIMSKGNTKKRRGENDDTTDEPECVLPKPKHAKYSRHNENVYDYSSRTVKVAQSRRRPGQKRRKTHDRKSEEKDSNEANVMKVTWFMKETEKCIEVECGRNKALLFLSKLNSGSNGRCVYFKDSWLTPNEFQNISGRQMAKDWKRSIKHNGHCLKLLLLRNLIQPSPIQILEPSQPEQVASIQCLPDTEQKVQ